MRQELSPAIEDFHAHRESMGIAKMTQKSEKGVLRRFLTITGNILVESVQEYHIDSYFKEASKTRSARSRGIDTTTLRTFFSWAERTKRLGRNGNPMAFRRPPRFTPREWRGITVSKVPALLDSAKSPRDRILLATACFLMGRSVEFQQLRISNVRLDTGDVSYQIPKTYKTDLLPISAEYDEELRRWLTWYAGHVQGMLPVKTLDPNWYLIPAQTASRLRGYRLVDEQRLVPTRPVRFTHRIAQYALEAVGYPTRDENGKSLNEGMHTIRRSMARALYEQLRDEGDPQPVETVRAMLNHSTEAQTRHYIGLQSEREHRDARIKGRAMFPSLRAGNVVRLEVKQSG